MITKSQYHADRDRLLARIHQQLLADKRIIAAWLTGSLGRGRADQLSDVDLTAVVSDDVASVLCERTSMVRAGAPPERLALLSVSGHPAIIHENHHNAPDPGTFTAVVYEVDAISVDWTLVPESSACRPPDTMLLFEHRSITLCRERPAPEPTARRQRIGERAAFFWMMVPQAIKSLARNDLVHFHVLIHMLESTRDELAALIHEQPSRYRKGSSLPLSQTRQRGTVVILDLCQELAAILDEYQGGSEVEGIAGDPMPIIARLLQIVDDETGTPRQPG